MKNRGCGFILLAALLIISVLFPASARAADRCADGDHVFDVELIRAATGDSDGLRRYTCSVCGYGYDEVIPATGHIWGGWITDAEPSCTAGGHRHRICEKCGELQEESTDAVGHSYEETAQAPGCTESGLHIFTCSRCGDSYSEAGAPALGHDYLETVISQSTCTSEGVIKMTCSRCGDSYTISSPALTHRYSLTMTVQPEPGKAGWREYTCSLCGSSYREELPALPPQVTIAPRIDEKELPPVSDGANAVDFIFAGGLTAGTAGFLFSAVPYIRVLNWAKKKKRAIDARRRR